MPVIANDSQLLSIHFAERTNRSPGAKGTKPGGKKKFAGNWDLGARVTTHLPVEQAVWAGNA